MNIRSLTRFRAAATIAFGLCFLVVLAGATVRATGAGMGCPDWPLCYGCLIPPISADQLPSGFAQTYAVDGHPATFDAVKTWIEYSNRLIGAAAGLSLIVVTVLAGFVLRQRLSLGLLSVGSLAAVALVAWLGAEVVGTFLAPYAVTLHLLAAYLLLGLLLAQREISTRAIEGARPAVRPTAIAALCLVGLAFLAQWTLGIQTRDEVEASLAGQDYQPAWQLFSIHSYDLHKISAVFVGLSAALLAWLGWRGRARDPRLTRLTLLCAFFVLLQACVGLVLWFAHLPPWAKPFHLAFATAAWAAWFAAVLHSLPSMKPRV